MLITVTTLCVCLSMDETKIFYEWGTHTHIQKKTMQAKKKWKYSWTCLEICQFMPNILVYDNQIYHLFANIYIHTSIPQWRSLKRYSEKERANTEQYTSMSYHRFFFVLSLASLVFSFRYTLPMLIASTIFQNINGCQFSIYVLLFTFWPLQDKARRPKEGAKERQNNEERIERRVSKRRFTGLGWVVNEKLA